jgi:hypothetical protein
VGHQFLLDGARFEFLARFLQEHREPRGARNAEQEPGNALARAQLAQDHILPLGRHADGDIDRDGGGAQPALGADEGRHAAALGTPARRGRAGASQQRLDVRQELGRMGRLGQVVVGAGLKALDFVIHLGLGREHQDRNGGEEGIGAQTASDLKAVEVGHHDVEQDQVGAITGGLAQGLGAVNGRHDRIPPPLEHHAHQLQGVEIIVDDEDLLGHA